MTPEQQFSRKLDFSDAQDMKKRGSYLYPFVEVPEIEIEEEGNDA
jgi:hypothetical protein